MRYFLPVFLLLGLSCYGQTLVHQERNPLKQNLFEQLQYYAQVDEQIDFELATLQVCDNFSSMVKNQIVDDELVAFQSALLARILVERLRNSVNFNGENKSNFFAQYNLNCQSLLNQADISRQPSINYQSSAAALAEHALLLIQLAFQSLSSHPDSPYISYVYVVQWLYYNLQDDHKLAKQSATKAVASHDAELAIVSLAEKYSYLGTSLLQLGHFREALLNMRKGLASALKNNNSRKYVDAHFGLGFAYIKVGDYDSAKRYFEWFVRHEINARHDEALMIQDCTGYSIRAIKGLVNLGKIDREIGDYEKALAKHSCAIEVLEKHNDYYYYVALLEKAKVLQLLGLASAAQEIANRLIEKDNVFVIHQLQALLLMLSTELELKPKKLNQQLVNEISKIIGTEIEKVSFPLEFIQFSQLKMEHAARIGDEVAFMKNAKAGFAMIKKYRESGLLSDTWLAAQYGFVDGFVNAVYSNRSYSSEHKVATILNVLDSYYGLNYFAQQNKSLSKQSNLSNDVKQLISEQRLAERSLLTVDIANKTVKQIALDEAKDTVMAFHYSDKAQVRANNDKLELQYSLSEIQQVLANDELMIRYFLNDKYTFAIVISKQQAFIKALPSRAEIHQAVAALSEAVNHKQVTKLMRSKVLMSLLPIDYLQKPQFNKLVIIPDDVLHRLPFAAIDTADTGRRYRPLANKLEIIRTHSVRDYLFNDIQNDNDNKLTIFADPAFVKLADSNPRVSNWSEGLKRLKHTAKEALAIQSTFGENNVTVYQGEQVTNQRLMAQSARRSKVLHIATHGYFNPATPDVVGIATYSPTPLFDDSSGFLSLSELVSKPFHSDLVVISGCETMLGKYYKGSGMKSFTRGFLSNGAGSVIGSLWQVPDRSTALFMSYFYQALKITGNSAKAIMQAKKRLSKHEDFYEPFYWSGFALTVTNRAFEQIEF